jgi:hypothetical protein
MKRCKEDYKELQSHLERNRGVLKADSVLSHVILRLALLLYQSEEATKIVEEISEFVKDSSMQVRLYILYYKPFELIYSDSFDKRVYICGLKLVYYLGELSVDHLDLWVSECKSCVNLMKTLDDTLESTYTPLIRSKIL